MSTDEHTPQSAADAPIKKTWEWVEEKAKHKHATWWLGWYSFLETVILPVPTDIFLAIMVLANRSRAIFLTFITTLTSIIGAAVGYMIAALFFTVVAGPLISFFGMEEAVAHAATTLEGYTFIAVLLGAFTPFPYTPVVYAAGFLHVDFIAFIVASIIGRSLRYALVSIATLLFGATVLAHLSRLSTRSTAIVAIVAGVVAVIAYALIS